MACSCSGQFFLPGQDPARPGEPQNPGEPIIPVGPARELPGATARVVRLSHQAYENTVRDLLGLSATTGLTKTFVGDVSSTVFTNNGSELVVNSDLWADYQRAAEALAEQATATPAALSALLEGAAVPADAQGFIRALGARVLRRPLAADEVDAYVPLYASGPTGYPAMPVDRAGPRVVLEAMLQSPHFLYRLELSTGVKAGVIPLSGPELANRLSYALWQSMPDGPLRAAAASGALLTPEGYQQQVARMLLDAKTTATVEDFHAQLFKLSKAADVTRSATLFPDFSVQLRTSMVEEHRQLVRTLAIDEDKGLKALLTSNVGFVDQSLARVYGLSGSFDSTFKRVTFDNGQRAGLLTQLGFLAVNSTAIAPDAIHRGEFVNRRILCTGLPAPPMVIPPIPPEDPAVKRTLRERITLHTGPGTCGAGCHGSLINPAGFAFEHYDAIGKWRTTDNTLPVDATDSFTLDGTPQAYDGAPAFADKMAQSVQAHRCYAGHWMQFLGGRALAVEDAVVLDRVGKASQSKDLSVRSVLSALVTTEAFAARAKDVP